MATSDDTQAIRMNMRYMNMDSRKEHRNQKLDAVRMGLGEIEAQIKELDTITVQDVHGLACRIKRRRQADSQDLLRLSRAFLHSIENITAFTNTTGALNVIVKELTGTEIDMQILACECLCNLSLGPEVACTKLALAASSYLLTFLDSTCARLQIISLWTITNLCACEGSGAAKVLISQKIVPKLMALPTTNTYPEDITTEAYKALNLLLQKHAPLVCADLDANQCMASLLAMLHKNPSNDWGTIELIYRTLEAYDYQINLSLGLDTLRMIVESIMRDISRASIDPEYQTRSLRKCVFSLRVIGNLIVDNVVGMLTMKSLLGQHPTLFQAMLAMDDVLARDILWLVGMIGAEHVGTLAVPNTVRAGIVL